MKNIANNFEQFYDQSSNKKIVFTNGCFDILHVGHIRLLNDAKKLGDILVVGINSDSSVKKLKGENRPVNIESDRKTLLESLKSVDYVFTFDEDNPLNLIKKIRPNILVKGGDYNENIIGSDFVIENGGEVKILFFHEGYSSSKYINQIKKA
ncbi:MAG: D-glycero-beta-D-manno-heptose 1-phosphate adenylyltransferase [Pelagibacteraceae bacterium]